MEARVFSSLSCLLDFYLKFTFIINFLMYSSCINSHPSILFLKNCKYSNVLFKNSLFLYTISESHINATHVWPGSTPVTEHDRSVTVARLLEQHLLDEVAVLVKDPKAACSVFLLHLLFRHQSDQYHRWRRGMQVYRCYRRRPTISHAVDCPKNPRGRNMTTALCTYRHWCTEITNNEQVTTPISSPDNHHDPQTQI